MRVKINRNVCPAHLAFCERCLGQFMKYPYGYERRCFEEIEEDGKEELTLEIHSGEHDVTLVLDEAQRQLVAGEGWAYFVDFPVPMYRDEVAQQKHG
jgi:hypothetical protein